MATKRSITRKGLAVGLAVLGISGLSLASAASLGGLATGSLGAEADLVASCDDSGVTVDWGKPEYSTSMRAYMTSQIILRGVDKDCVGKKFDITVSNSEDVAVAWAKGTSDGSAKYTTDLKVDVPSTELVNVAVVIYD